MLRDLFLAGLWEPYVVQSWMYAKQAFDPLYYVSGPS